MKLKVTRYKPSGKYYDEFAVDLPSMYAWEDEDLRGQAKAAFDGQEYSTVEAVL